MTNEEILNEFKVLERQHAISKWLGIFLGIVVTFFGLYLIGDTEIGYRDNFSLGNVIFPMGGSLLGYTVSNWSGNKAHKLLRALAVNLTNGYT